MGGSCARTAWRRLIDEHRIGAVVDLRAEDCDDEGLLSTCGVSFLHLPTEDHAGPTPEALDAGVAFAAEAARSRRKLLIHCEHGIGRSATLALCVLVHRGMAPLAALELAKSRRELVSPSPAQFESWRGWLGRHRRPDHGWSIPEFDGFCAIAYRHLAAQAAP